MAAAGWYQLKLLVEHASGVSMDALHVIVGFLIFLVSAVLLRRGMGSPLPLLVLFVLELGNEAYDLNVEQWPDPGMQYGEGLKDIMLTVALPALLFAMVRWKPSLLNPRRSSDKLADHDMPDGS